MAASPLITAWAGLRPSHFELARERPETGPPEVALDRSPGQAGPSLAQCPETQVPVRKGVWSGLRWQDSIPGPASVLKAVLAGTGAGTGPGTGLKDQIPVLGPVLDGSRDRSCDCGSRTGFG